MSEELPIHIAQVSDIHIGFDRAGGDGEANLLRFKAVLRRLAEQPTPIDLLVLSGDLTDCGDSESFARLTDALRDMPCAVLPMVGNHDAREALLSAFPECPSDDGFVHYAVERAGLRLLMLDTFEPGRHGGAFCEVRAQWLADQLAGHPDTPTLIFMHHPPIVSGIDWMDPDPGEGWIARFGEAIAGHSQIAAIHCGHLHRAVQASYQGVPLGITPSTAPPVALDLTKVSPDRPDGRTLITGEAPAYALHRWDGSSLVSHYEYVSDWPVLARYDVGLQPMIRGMLAERN